MTICANDLTLLYFNLKLCEINRDNCTDIPSLIASDVIEVHCRRWKLHSAIGTRLGLQPIQKSSYLKPVSFCVRALSRLPCRIIT